LTGGLSEASILVCGGGSGIGRAVVDAYAAEGAHITIVERSAEAAERLRRDHGRAVRVVVGDATDIATLREAVGTAVSAYGGLDNLTCTVGVFDFYASIKDMSISDLVAAADEAWRTNALSALVAIKVAYVQLQQRHGSITVTLSESAFHPAGGGVLYGSTKCALRGLVSHLSRDLAPDVRVNGVAPGGTTGTQFAGLRALRQTQTADRVDGRDQRIQASTLLGVVPTPADHAAAYVYLADPGKSRVLTGVIINTDGGKA
jgi:NAD(P)-dependent dehydrogenase (short-subunit alcohol dehydrogenase family)